jgi:mRNA-degrading endonuclease RelE of RelBE toxin-antitoxin system
VESPASALPTLRPVHVARSCVLRCRSLQAALANGLRKVRWAATGRGKRGGVRVIYYWAADREVILMLLIYGKNEQDDLTSEQLRLLKRLVDEEFK